MEVARPSAAVLRWYYDLCLLEVFRRGLPILSAVRHDNHPRPDLHAVRTVQVANSEPFYARIR